MASITMKDNRLYGRIYKTYKTKPDKDSSQSYTMKVEVVLDGMPIDEAIEGKMSQLIIRRQAQERTYGKLGELAGKIHRVHYSDMGRAIEDPEKVYEQTKAQVSAMDQDKKDQLLEQLLKEREEREAEKTKNEEASEEDAPEEKRNGDVITRKK